MIFDEKYVLTRINRSKETLNEAKLMFENGYYLTVINRLYYAIFYLACAYLAKGNIVTKTHNGTKNKFHDSYVKTGIVDVDFGKIYNWLFSERNNSDYGDFEILSKEDVESLLRETETVLNKYWKKFEEIEPGK